MDSSIKILMHPSGLLWRMEIVILADGSMKEEETQVRVFDSPTLLCDAQNAFFNFGEVLSTCRAHVRANCSDIGTMHGFGQRVCNGQLGDDAPHVSDMKTDSAKHWKAVALRGFCAAATSLLCVILNTWFPDDSKLMQDKLNVMPEFYPENQCVEKLIKREI
jgi:hypothetical protein